MTGYNTTLFATQPNLTSDGKLTFTTAPNMFGNTTVKATLSDGNSSVYHNFNIFILSVNDQPTFTDIGDVEVNEDCGIKIVNWVNASSIILGPANEGTTHTFVIKNTAVTSLAGNTSLFSAGPTINTQTGAITFTPAANANGTAVLTVYLKDNDGTDRYGVDTSTEHTFTLKVKAIDDDPTYTLPASVTVWEDSGTFSQADFAKGITPGGGTDESAQSLTFTLTDYQKSLFEVEPTLSSTGSAYV